MVAEEAVPWGLAGIQDPDLPRDIMSLGFIKGLQILEGKVSFSIDLTTPACPARKQMEEAAQTTVAALPGVGVTTSRDPHSPSLPGVLNLIAAPPREGRRR